MEIIVIAVVVLIVAVVITLLIHGLCNKFNSTFGDLIAICKELIRQAKAHPECKDPPPRSLGGCESIMMPEIRKDFPDFDPTLAKNKAREYLQRKLQMHKGLQIHNVVLHRYLDESLQKTVVFQAAVSWNGKPRVQKRYDVYYTYAMPEVGGKGCNCPNCGATIGFGQVECEYCGTRIVNTFGQSWEFTQLLES